MSFGHVEERGARGRLAAAARALTHARREHALLVLANSAVAAALAGYCVLAGPGAVESWQRHGVSDLGFVVVSGLLAVVLACIWPWMATARRAVQARSIELARAQHSYDAAFARMLAAE